MHAVAGSEKGAIGKSKVITVYTHTLCLHFNAHHTSMPCTHIK